MLYEWPEGTLERDAYLDAADFYVKHIDRISICGQVFYKVTGNFEVGDYVVAFASGVSKMITSKTDDITLDQYMRHIGEIWVIRDGRA